MPHSTSLIALAASLTALAACAGSAPPTAQLNSAAGAMRAAEELGAEEYPPAATHLVMAREAFAKGQALIKEEEMEQAELLLKRAKADAEYALVLARVEKTREEAARISKQASELEAEAFDTKAKVLPPQPQPQPFQPFDEAPESDPLVPDDAPFEE